MTEPKIDTHSALTSAIEIAWSDLQGFLDSLTEGQLGLKDEHGWTIGDHVAHLAAWEDSVAILFRGRPRHEALGVDEQYYFTAPFHELNDTIRERGGEVSGQQSIAELSRIHNILMESLARLSEADLHNSVRDFFPEAARSDERRVIDFIHEDTANHFVEHLEWMRNLANRPA